MSDATNQVLEQAYSLIEADRLDEAEALLKPVLAEDPDNVDAWWLYVHAVKDVETARMALNTVLKLDPTYPGATDLLSTLEQRFPMPLAAATTGTVKRLAPPTSLPDLPEDDDIDAPFDLDSGVLPPVEPVAEDKFAQAERKLAAAQAAAQQRRRFNPIWLALGALIAVVALVVLFLALRGGQTPPIVATATLVSQGFPDSTAPVIVDATEVVTAEVTIAATDELDAAKTEIAAASTVIDQTPDVTLTEEATSSVDATAEVTQDTAGGAPVASTPAAESEITAVASALAAFDAVEGSTGKQVTLLGNTLLTDVCSAPDAASLGTVLAGSMTALAGAGSAADTDTQALGLRLVDCDTGEVLRVIAVPLESALSFASGSIDDATFQARWVAVA